MKRVIVIHGYKSYPGDCWFPWLEKELTKKGVIVSVPRLPTPSKPKQNEWVKTIERVVGNPDEYLFLIGHSLGSIAIVRYLETLKGKKRIGGIITVAGRFIRNQGMSRHPVANFFSKPINWRRIRRKCKKFNGIYSVDDPVVSIENGRLMKERLKAKLTIERNKGHFDRKSKIYKLPSVLKAILSIAR